MENYSRAPHLCPTSVANKSPHLYPTSTSKNNWKSMTTNVPDFRPNQSSTSIQNNQNSGPKNAFKKAGDRKVAPPLPPQQPCTTIKCAPHVMKELQDMVNKMYGYGESSQVPQQPWRDDRPENEREIPEQNYYCCPYSRGRTNRHLVRTLRPMTFCGRYRPLGRRTTVPRLYRRGRIRQPKDEDIEDIPYFLRNSS